MVWLLLALQSFISAAGLILLRWSMPQLLPKFFSAPPLALTGGFIGMLFYAGSFLLWMFILSKNPVSFAYPVTIGLTLGFTVLGSVFLLGEKVTFLQIFGIALMAVSVFLVSQKG